MTSSIRPLLVVSPSPAWQRRVVFAKFALGEVNRAKEVSAFASGKGVNAARAVARLGSQVETVLVLGGATGQWLRQDMEQEGLAVKVAWSTTPTRICMTLIDAAMPSATEIVENAAGVEQQTVDEFFQLVEQGLASAGAVLCTGTLPGGFPADSYGRVVAMARRAGNLPVVVDAQGEIMREACLAGCDVAKPNLKECATMFGRTMSGGEACRALMELGAGAAVVTNEASEVFVSDASGVRVCRPPLVAAKNPVGAGDTLAGVLAENLARKITLDSALLLAIGAAAAGVAGEGYGRIDAQKACDLAGLIAAPEPVETTDP